MSGRDVHGELVDLLRAGGARFRVVEHAAEGRSEQIARIRGNRPEQALKAIVVTLKGGGMGTRHALAVLPGNRRLDTKALKAHFGASKAGFAAPETATEMTGCPMGAVPPFSFRDDLPLIADPLIRDNDEVCFNAGRLDRSVFMDADDYVALAKPAFAAIAAPTGD